MSFCCESKRKIREMMYSLRIATLLFFSCLSLTSAANVLRVMQGQSVDQFKQLLVNSPIAQEYLQKEVTIFAPSDAFMEKYTGPKDDQFILNHIVNVMVSLNTLTRTPKTTTVGSMLPASPNLYIMRSGGQQFYVNGVKVSKRNLQATSDVGRKKQVLHVVEGVLQPLTPKKRSDSDRYIDLTAGKLIRQAGDYDLGKHSVSNYARQVKTHQEQDLFEQPGVHTFFIPIDAAFNSLAIENVKSEVIHGHVVPDRLLFTMPSNPSKTEKTATYEVREDDNDKDFPLVVAAIQPQGRNGFQVKSSTNRGTSNLPRGQVVANIVRANIPVKNGVVHLIDRPLVIISQTMADYLKNEENRDLRLSKFARYIRQYGIDLLSAISKTHRGTLFAPSNDAFDVMSPQAMEKLLTDPEKGKRSFS